MKIDKLLLIFIALFLLLSSCNVGEEEEQGSTDGEKKPIINIHIHKLSDEIIENAVPATCVSDGSYESVYYCIDCGKEMSRVTEIVKSEGHDSTEPLVEVDIPVTCLADGRRETATYCTVCNEELSREIETFVTEGHIESAPVVVYDTEVKCKSEGSRTETISCTRCQAVLSSTTEIVPAIGHKWADGKCEKCGVAFSATESLEFALSDDGTYYIITGIGTFYETELIMPSEYNGLPVKEIADYAFKNCTFIVRAVIPSSIVRLGYGAAEGCTGVKELILEDRKGWSLYDGQENPKIFPIPSLLLIDTSRYFDLLLGTDQFALVKKG